MALQQKEPAFMAGLAKMAQEEMDEIIRHVVKKEVVIDIRYLQREVTALLSPFFGYNKYLEVAEEEVYKVNTFRMSMGDTIIDDEYTEVVAQQESDCVPQLRSLTTGRISLDHMRIRHLEVHLAIRIEGANFSRASSPVSLISEDVSAILSDLYDFFPCLDTLHIKIHNQGYIKAGCHIYVLPDDTCMMTTDPHSHQSRVVEQLLRMEEVLLLVGHLDTPGLREKSVEFIQNEKSSSCVRFNGTSFHSDRPSDMEQSMRGFYARKSRQLFMCCDLIGQSRNEIKEDFSGLIGISDEEFEREYGEIDCKKDIEMLQKILNECDRAVLHFPCGA